MELPSPALPLDVDPVRVEEFLKLIALHQRRLHLFVGGLVPYPPDAEDVLQETNLVLWREFRKFEIGSDFAAWACTVAFHQVLAWRKKKQRDRLVFSEAFLAAVSQELLDHDEQREEQASALAGCIARMPTHHRQLLALRYSDGQSIESIAERLQRTTDAIYRMLSRIRHALFDCTTRALSEGPT